MMYMATSRSRPLDESESVNGTVLDTVAAASNQSLVAVLPLQEATEPSAVVRSTGRTTRTSQTETPIREPTPPITGIS